MALEIRVSKYNEIWKVSEYFAIEYLYNKYIK